jgi:hypothetical protein
MDSAAKVEMLDIQVEAMIDDDILSDEVDCEFVRAENDKSDEAAGDEAVGICR